MADVTRNSRFAIVKETTEGTPVDPSASTDYIALQEGFEMSPSFDELENAELTGSIGNAKVTLGLENPTASVDHYFRHSGVEGQAPNFGELVEAAVGVEDVRSTERDTVASSTTSVIKVDSGEGSEFERGDSLLIKDGTNGYSIRPVLSVSTDDLNLGLNLSNAPASGVNLGKNVLYKPSDDAHPTLSAWLYRGNKTSIELMSGSRVTEMGIEVPAGEFINGSFSMEGNEYFFDPLTIDATNDDLDFNDGGGEENVSITQKTYKDPHELASAIQTAMNAATSDNITVTYNSSGTNIGKFTIATDGVTLSLLWDTGTNTATTIGDKIGFDTSADDTGSTSYVGDNKITLTSPQTPSFDSANPLVAKSNELYIGDADDLDCISAANVTFTLSNTKQDILSVCADSGKEGAIFSERSFTAEVDALLTAHDAEKFLRFRQGTTTRLFFIAGTKSGGNWEAGKSFSVWMPTATISNFEPSDRDGLVSLNMTLTSFVDSGNGEVYINFL